MITHHDNQGKNWGDDDVEDDNWSFEDDDILFESNNDDITDPMNSDPSTGKNHSSSPEIQNPNSFPTTSTPQSLFEEIQMYFHFLSHPTTIPKIRRLLASNSSPTSLLSYYASRPNLKSYTLETELQRMSYTIRDGPQFLKDKSLIQRRYSPPSSLPQSHDILLRSANQSLLADAIAALTGDDRLIRPRYGTTCAATSCDFFVDLNEGEVRCVCFLTVAIPAVPEAVTVADLELRVVFAPDRGGRPSLEMDVLQLVPRKVTEVQLARVVNSLVNDEIEFRETVVKTRDDMVSACASGMSSALKQMDAVVNVRSKFNFFKGLSSSFLPSADLLAAAEEEQNVFRGTNEMGRRQRAAEDVASVRKDDDWKQREVEEPEASNSSGRPIIGGLLMQNLNKLAAKAAQPDATTDVKLYNRDEEPNTTNKATLDFPTKKQKDIFKDVPVLETIESSVVSHEGWSDDELNLSDKGDDDDDDDVNDDDDDEGGGGGMEEQNLGQLTTGFESESNTIHIIEEDEDIVPTRTRWRRPFRNRRQF